MSRPILFRAWDKVNKQMVTNILSIDVGFSGGNNIYTSEGNYIKRDDCELMQFTGMKAKNGPIYEGDIVQFRMSGELITREVKWVEERSGWTPLYKCSEDLEIIGNIYSTPELISNTT